MRIESQIDHAAGFCNSRRQIPLVCTFYYSYQYLPTTYRKMGARNKARSQLSCSVGAIVAVVVLYTVAVLYHKDTPHTSSQNMSHSYVQIARAEECNKTRLHHVIQIRQKTKSNCPDRTPWWTRFAGGMSEGRMRPLVHVNIGCNKGVDFLATLHDLSGDDRYSPMAYLERLAIAGIAFPNRGACGQIEAAAHRVRPTLSSTRRVLGYCIEPGNSTFQVLKVGMKELQSQGRVFLGQYAVGSAPGEAFFPNVEPGIENQGLSKTTGVPVAVTTLDEYAKSMGIDHIDLLSIDTEGNDVNVLYGGLNTLTSGVVRILEFEVHAVGHWRVSRVDNIVSMLDNSGFTCYWHLNGLHPLLRATGCMAEELENNTIKTWSNIVCVNRRDIEVAAMFETLSKQTESAALEMVTEP